MDTVTPRDVATIFHEIQTLLDLHGADEFKSKAYGRAARMLESAGDMDLLDLVSRGMASSIPGIGKGLAHEVAEIVAAGASSQLEELRSATPPGLLEMLKIRGLGAKKVRTIRLSLDITTLAALEDACRRNAVAHLPGFGAKSQANILAGVEELKRNAGLVRIDVATQVAELVSAELHECPSVRQLEIAGRLRRGGEVFDRVELVIQADVQSLRADLINRTLLQNFAVDGDRIDAIGPEGLRVVVHCSTERTFPVDFFQRTGSRDHLLMVDIALEQRGARLERKGMHAGGAFSAIADEVEIYSAAGLPFIPPELREGIDEVALGLEGRLPVPLDLADMRGMIHVHSTWSDGRHPIREIAEVVRGRGYHYLLVTDHSKAAFYANGLDERRLEAQGREIDSLNAEFDPEEFVLLKGVECDILADGALDLANDALAALDAVIVSIHSRFELPMEAQTERIIRALENPAATILGHPTGRLLLGRDGYEIDHRQVIDAAARLGKGIEINANPRRLDISWRMLRHAVARNVPVAISPDAHAIPHFDYMPFGIMVGRKGGLTKDRTINAMSADALRRKAWGAPAR